MNGGKPDSGDSITVNRGGRMSAEDSAGAEFWHGGMFAFMKAKHS